MTEITFSQVGYDLARLNQHNVAFEGFIDLMEGRRTVTGSTAHAIHIALETTVADMDTITGQDLSHGLKKIYVTIRNIIKWLLTNIGKAFVMLGAGMQRLGESGKKNSVRLKSMSSEDAGKLKTEEELKDHSFKVETLCIAGEFSGNEIEHVQAAANMATWLLDGYMGGVLKVFEALPALAEKHANDKEADAFLKEFGSLIGSSMSYPKVRMANENLAKDFDVNDKHSINTAPLLGDYGLVMFDFQDATSVFAGGVEKIQSYMKVGVVPYETKKDTANTTIPLPSQEELIRLNDTVMKAVEYWNSKNGSINGQVEATTKKLNEVVETLSKSESPAANSMANAIATVLQNLGSAINDGSKWVGRTFNNELQYISKSIEQVTGPAKEE